jgi:hypothetical protein
VACWTIIKGHWKAITQHFGTIEAIASFQMIEDLCPFICRESRNVIRTFNLNFEIAQQLSSSLTSTWCSLGFWAVQSVHVQVELRFVRTSLSLTLFLDWVSEIIWPKYQHTMMLYPQSL